MIRVRRHKAGPLIMGAFLTLTLTGIAACLLLSKPPLLVQGEVDATEIKLAPKVVGRVQALSVHKGDQVKKSQMLVLLESRDLQAKLEQARAAMALAKEEHAKMIRGSRVEDICAQSNLWVKAKAVTEQAERTATRLRKLQATDAISLQQVQDADRDWEVAQSSERAAKATFDLAVAGFREEDTLAAAAKLEQASAAVEELEALVAELKLTSPIEGELQDRIVEEGELVSPGLPVVSIVNLQDVWMTFNLREDLLANIRMGSIFRVRVPALGNKEIPVKVNYIAPKGDFATWRATKATGDFDLKTFEVRAVPTEATEGLRPGMSVLATWGKSK
jgi:HlyD family secretion protein